MEKIIVFDFGSQYTHLISRRIRQLGVYSEIRNPDTSLKDMKNVKGIILSGGPKSVHKKSSPKINKRILDLGIPVLGICYGHQLISHLLGGKLGSGTSKEYGIAILKTEKNHLFKGLEKNETVWMSHYEHVKDMPKGFKRIGSTHLCRNAAICDENETIFGLQFHPEVTHSRNGMVMLNNFIKRCRIKKEWSTEKQLESLNKDVVKRVGNKNVLLLVSGGVDSIVAFVLLRKFLGKEKVIGLHVDTGLMRLKESEHISKELRKLDLNIKTIDASDEFLEKLEKVTDPEKKRNIIGKEFITVTNKAIKDMGLKDWILAQGTIYPDTIESGDTKNSAKIKTHHNRVSIVKDMISKGLIIEPLRELYKDEVRELGKRLNIPCSMVMRHPFPGPGLAIRCLCQDKYQGVKKSVENKANAIAECYFLNAKILPIKSVGVQGDSRSYKNPAMLIGQSSWDHINRVSVDICNKIDDVNRVVWRIAGNTDLKPKKAYLTRERLGLLREIDFIVRRFIWKNGYFKRIWQMPVVLIPLGDEKRSDSVVLRPVCSTEAMSANFTRMSFQSLRRLAREIMETHKISSVLYDITNKPPGTVEWE